METTACHFHIHDPDLAAALPLCGGDDAARAMWLPLLPGQTPTLYASHSDWVTRVANTMYAKMRTRRFT